MRWFPTLILGLLALINLGRGGVHAFAPDGGAHSIAGLDLGGDRQTILALFATMGLGQITKGIFEAYVVLRRRDLVALFLALQTVDTAFAMANLYLWRPFPVTVPGQPFNIAMLAVQVVALAMALRPAKVGAATA